MKRFTYGDQFDPQKTPLHDLLSLAINCDGDRAELQEAVRANYFPGHGSADNSGKMAMNCVLSMKAYRLIDFDKSGKRYEVPSLTKEIFSLSHDEAKKRFAIHILSELDGLLLLRLIENIRARGEQLTLEYIGEELNDLGLKIPPNSTYVSTMRAWLAQAGVFRATGYEINWDVAYDLLHIDPETVNSLYGLTPEQKYFLLALVRLAPSDSIPSNKVAEHARSVFSVRVTTKNLVKDVIAPLEAIGLVNSVKTTTGRGAKPHDVSLTDKAKNEFLEPLVQSLTELTELTSADLNRTFEDVVAELNHEDKHIRGLALELLAVWFVRLLGLRFTSWRLRSYQATGGAEVDVLAASDRVIYNRWQIQCKNTVTKVDVDTIAKEVGLTFMTKADVIMVVTTADYTSDTVNYANQVMSSMRCYIILLDGSDLKRIIADRSTLIEILNIKARRVFARRELGITEFDDSVEDEGTDVGVELAEEAENLFSGDAV